MDYTQLIDELIKQETLSFGDPWRFSTKSLAIVVPIIKKQKSRQRNYYVIEEVKDKIEFTDTGSIGGVRAKSNADKPVFVRSGSQFGSKGGAYTQERSATMGTILLPQKPEILTAVCIHASQGIRTGALFGYSGLVPHSVHRAVKSRNQHATWNAVSNYCMSVSSRQEVRAGEVAMDDLVGFQERLEHVDSFKKQVDDLLSKIPADLNSQVGIIVLDINGVVGLELFNHEDSWKAFSQSIAKSYSEILINEQETADIFELKQEGLISHIAAFLDRLKSLAHEKIWENEKAITFKVEDKNILGEFTVLKSEDYLHNDQVIHLVLTKKTTLPQADTFSRQLIPFSFRDERTQQTEQRTETDPLSMVYTTTTADFRNFLSRKGSTQFLANLRKPKTWSELEDKVEVSTRTLSKLTKNGLTSNIIQKTLRENGKVAYQLTPLGEKIKKQVVENP